MADSNFTLKTRVLTLLTPLKSFSFIYTFNASYAERMF